MLSKSHHCIVAYVTVVGIVRLCCPWGTCHCPQLSMFVTRRVWSNGQNLTWNNKFLKKKIIVICTIARCNTRLKMFVTARRHSFECTFWVVCFSTSIFVSLMETQHNSIGIDYSTCTVVKIKGETAYSSQATIVDTRYLGVLIPASKYIKSVAPFKGTRAVRFSVTMKCKVKFIMTAWWVKRIGAFVSIVSIDSQ